MKRVLLISPMRGHDPANGDVVYTESLLEHPPPCVEYEAYPEAIEAGRLVELGRRDEYVDASGIGKLGALGRIGRERSVNALRKRGVLFREPFRFFSVMPGAYDLVHCHVFSAAFRSLDVPLVMSNACVIEGLYRAIGWSDTHVALASKADAALATGLRVQHASHRMPAAAAVVCFTEYLRAELIRRNAVRPDRLHVAPCFTDAADRVPARANPTRIGFTATEFEAKGGLVVLEAFELVRRERPDAELTVIGSPPRDDAAKLRARGITWLPRVDRTELLERHMPTFDAFAYPTNFDGLPLTMLEVMARGIPIATNDYEAMPEIIGHGEAGLVAPQGDTSAFADSLLRLLSPDENALARSRTAKWFDAHFAPTVATAELARAYESALMASRAGSGSS